MQNFAPAFPALRPVSLVLLWVFIAPKGSFPFFWLAVVITLILVSDTQRKTALKECIVVVCFFSLTTLFFILENSHHFLSQSDVGKTKTIALPHDDVIYWKFASSLVHTKTFWASAFSSPLGFVAKIDWCLQEKSIFLSEDVVVLHFDLCAVNRTMNVAQSSNVNVPAERKERDLLITEICIF